MKTGLTIALTISILGQGIGGIAIAALPDVQTYNFVTRKYSLLVRESRDGCVFYADPEFVVARSERPNLPQKDIRQLIVLQTSERKSGSACSGIFQFQYADVNCRTNEISYTNAIGSPAAWKTDRYSDPATAKKICALPTVEFGTPTQNLPPAK